MDALNSVVFMMESPQKYQGPQVQICTIHEDCENLNEKREQNKNTVGCCLDAAGKNLA
jgi:hypothetical protein